MAYEIEDDTMSLFLINSFLETGKTQFLGSTMQQDYFKTEGKTLPIVREEGDTEYDERRLKKSKMAAVFVDDMRELTPQYLNKLEAIYQPERVLMEWNGMWNQDDLKLPDDWAIHQQITTIDGPTFEPCVQNMKPFLGAMLRGSELIIASRCDGIPDDKLTTYRRIIHAMNRESETVLEDKEGEIERAVLEEDLFYDLGADIVEIKPEDHGIWYIGCIDQPERYKDEMVEFTVMALRSPKFPEGQFVPGRMAMTYYETDMTFLGFMCKWPGAEDYKMKQQARIRVRMGTEYQKDCHGKGPALYAEHVKRAEEIGDTAQFQE